MTKYRIDENKLVAIGHSMGGFLALMSGTMFPDFKGIASLAGFNFGLFIEGLRDNPDALQTLAENWEVELPPLRGTTGKVLVKETLISGHQWELTKYAPKLIQKSVLLVAASRDSVAPPELHHTPLVDALQKAGTQQLYHHILDSDHGFSDRRVALARLILDWLNTL